MYEAGWAIYISSMQVRVCKQGAPGFIDYS